MLSIIRPLLCSTCGPAHRGCNIVRFLAAVCTEEAEPARSNSSAIANNAGDAQKARCLEFYFDWLTGSQSKTCVEGHADAAHRAQSSSGYLFRCGPPREPGGQPGIAANDACSHL